MKHVQLKTAACLPIGVLVATIGACSQDSVQQPLCEPPFRVPSNTQQITRPSDYEPSFSFEGFESPLQIVVIDTGGLTIRDEPKIAAEMRIYSGQPTTRLDQPPVLEETVGIELRGGFSLRVFPKKQFGFEVRDAAGEDLDVSILDMPGESDWVLSGTYGDLTMLRNHLAFTLMREMKWWAPRTRLVELFLNQSGDLLQTGDYLGVYLIMERIKRDENRVDIKKLTPGDNSSPERLSGGYIVEMTDQEMVWPRFGTSSVGHI